MLSGTKDTPPSLELYISPFHPQTQPTRRPRLLCTLLALEKALVTKESTIPPIPPRASLLEVLHCCGIEGSHG